MCVSNVNIFFYGFLGCICQLENAGFGIKRAAILSVLQQSGVYKGAEEGKVRHQSGEWRSNEYRKHDGTAVKADKIAKAKHSSSKKLRKILYDLRINSALTQQQIATKLGCSRAYYCNIENGMETPSEAFWGKIAVLIGLDVRCEDIRKVSIIRQVAQTKAVAEQANTDNTEDEYSYVSSRYTSVDLI